MRVRITESFLWGFRTYLPGDELDVPDDQGVELLRQHVAQRLEPVPETAAPSRGERAVRMTRPAK